MGSARSFRNKGASFAAAGLFSLAVATASAQVPTTDKDATQSREQIVSARTVGVKGALRSVVWSDASLQDLTQLRLEKTAATLSRTPGAMRHTKVWVARADVCSEAGEETLVQIRSPLTCGSLGCQMMILSEAGVAPRVLMQTVGDTIDAPALDEIVINSGDARQRVWRYDRGLYQKSKP